MAVQDDARENELIELFRLQRPAVHTRGGTDAELDLDGHLIQFELKSTSNGSVTTVRDFGMDHIRAWEDKHWLIGFYNTGGSKLIYCCYGSPQLMSPWIEEKRIYIKPDFDMSELVYELIDLECMYKILGRKQSYSLEEAKILHKKQYSVIQYRDLMDIKNGYTPERMLEIFKARCKYLMQRGSTLNNPHIPDSYFATFEKITQKHAHRLRELVKASI